MIEAPRISAKRRLPFLDQHHLQSTAMPRPLRPSVARLQTARLVPDHAPIGHAIHQIGDRNAELDQLIQQPKLSHLAHRMRQHIDTHA